MSYVNMIMYSSVLPDCHGNKDGEENGVINADDPRNRDRIKDLLFG